jgi:MHS family metabolite:H+ symporter-like MFS transporter
LKKVNEAETTAPVTKHDLSFAAMVKSKSFWLATGLRFGQAGNSGLIQTFLAGYLVQTLLFDKAIPHRCADDKLNSRVYLYPAVGLALR